ncbi:YpiF family protein [Paenibacillus sp. N3/727]|uniref:DUF2487 family protein n=1 Tax=Paenibacillus sp. N3/727 TaxID=2925845 RepID=UPI001F52D667|nr:DUF2487 family protein [Paenibacillus sp. N3/727]UNK20538.1 YpiF family protein [Paenibacillus sp. N3/727]
MKFSEVDEQTWPELQTYFDTCLIPYTGLTGHETPWEATASLERLRDFMDLVEVPFKGRVVTYPAMQYGGTPALQLLNDICHKVKSTGFIHVVVMTADCDLDIKDIPESALVLSQTRLLASGDMPISAAVTKLISGLWQKEDEL